MKTMNEDDDYRNVLCRQLVEQYLRATDFTIVGRAGLLWSAWECDHEAVLVRRDSGQVHWVILGGVNVSPRNVVETLREKLVEYKRAYEGTERLLNLAEKEGLA